VKTEKKVGSLLSKIIAAIISVSLMFVVIASVMSIAAFMVMVLYNASVPNLFQVGTEISFITSLFLVALIGVIIAIIRLWTTIQNGLIASVMMNIMMRRRSKETDKFEDLMKHFQGGQHEG